MTTTTTPVDNGVNVEALLGVRDPLPDTYLDQLAARVATALTG